MANEITVISPEGLEIANSFLCFGNIDAVCKDLSVSQHKVTEILATKEVSRYLDAVYLDRGYRNRNRIGDLLDEMIESKLEEAQESGIYTNKDLADLMMMAHKMRMDEIKAQEKASTNIKTQTNVQINDTSAFGQGEYGKLMEKLINGEGN